jgi:hypothetical protein
MVVRGTIPYTFTPQQDLKQCAQETFVNPCIAFNARFNRLLRHQFRLAQTYLGQSFIKLVCHEPEHIMIAISYVISSHTLTIHVHLNNFQSRRTKQRNGI